MVERVFQVSDDIRNMCVRFIVLTFTIGPRLVRRSLNTQAGSTSVPR